ncbi:phage tail assembly chaperone [uncultured Parasutterella sp.]|uniref:phage tail assembly chaperone n=1 Tax=uncultured Parasutterella sp. TaxID=1263098 RepID=UPI002599261E|nr:hypothetical protein [uncultured Parasutterella sp.]
MKEPKIIKVEDGGRQLTFKIYPFSATKSEDLMIRIALMTGKNLDIESALGYKDVIKALVSVPHVEAKALLDELLSEVYKIDGKSEAKFSFDDADGYISSPLTIIKLRIESFKVNFGFFPDLVRRFYPEEPSS